MPVGVVQWPCVPVMKCLDDAELLALVEQRMSRTARELAFVHLEACRMCLELVTAVLRSLDETLLDARLEQTLEGQLELRLDER